MLLNTSNFVEELKLLCVEPRMKKMINTVSTATIIASTFIILSIECFIAFIDAYYLKILGKMTGLFLLDELSWEPIIGSPILNK